MTCLSEGTEVERARRLPAVARRLPAAVSLNWRDLVRRLLAGSPSRYVVVGAVCASLNWALMLLIDGDRYLLSSILLFVPIGTLGFLLHAFWTFREEPSLRSWLAYLVGMLPGSAVSLAVLAAMRDVVGLPLALALPATVAMMTALNYCVAWAAIAGLAPRRIEHVSRIAATTLRRTRRIAYGIFRQLKPHVRGRTTPLGRDVSLAVPFRYDLSRSKPPASPVAVVCHVFYPDLAGELRDVIANIPYPTDVFISTDTPAKRHEIATAFADWTYGPVEIRIVPNRGRDIAPKLIGFRDVFERHDIVLLLHGKKTPEFDKGDAWRKTLTGSLAGSTDTVRSILDIFRLDPNVGMVICQHFEPIHRYVGWHHNFKTARHLAARMGVDLTPRHTIDLPSGSMFWTRSAAIRPLLDLGLTIEDFPEERGQTNETLAHAIERLFLYGCEAAGFKWVKVADRGLFERQNTISTASCADDVRAFVATRCRSLLSSRDLRHRAARIPEEPAR